MGEKYTDVGSAKNSQVFSRFSKLLFLTNFFQEYYDDMAEDYETVVRAWGYNCPEVKKLYFPRIRVVYRKWRNSNWSKTQNTVLLRC